MASATMPLPECWEAAQSQFHRKIKTYARNSFHVVPGFAPEDMENELLAVLWKCVVAYDPDNGASFNTFAQRSFQNRIGMLRRAANSLKRSAEWVSLDDEAVKLAVEEANFVESAESEVFLRTLVEERLRAQCSKERRKRRDSSGPSESEAVPSEAAEGSVHGRAG